MAQPKTQTLSLGEYWNTFIENQLAEKRYASASEVVRESLRLLEEKQAQSMVTALRKALIAGEKSNEAGVLDMEEVKAAARRKAGLT